MRAAADYLVTQLKKLEIDQDRALQRKQQIELDVSVLAREIYDRASGIEDVKSAIASLTA